MISIGMSICRVLIGSVASVIPAGAIKNTSAQYVKNSSGQYIVT